MNWFFTGIYGYPEEQNKWRTWDLISDIGSNINEPWLCHGDLNDTMAASEKLGGNDRSHTQLHYGRQVMTGLNHNDLGFEGYPFTWSNGREGTINVEARFEKALGNSNLLKKFSPIKVTHLPRFIYDHATIMIQLEAHQGKQRHQRPKLFRFKESWTSESNCEQVTRRQRVQNGTIVMEKLKQMSGMGKDFEHHNLGSIKKEIYKLEKMLKDTTLWSGDAIDIQRYKSLERQHEDLLKIQEKMWRKRSRPVWLKNGDGNTVFS